jgi:phosphate transport system substrate-binding protein
MERQTKENSVRRTLAILSSVGVVAASVLVATPAVAKETIPGGGASFPSVFLQDCATRFNGSQNNFTVNYQSVGSGAGKRGFANQTFVFGATESAYDPPASAPSFGWQYVPIIAGGITLPINLRGKNGKPIGNLINIRQSTMGKIFGGQITNWDHPEIVKANPRIAKNLPNTPILVAYRSDGSGTTNNFLQYLNAWTPSIFPKVQDAMDTAFPGGRPPTNSQGGPQNAGVMNVVATNNGAIGYVDLGDALKAGARMARLQNSLGEFVAPTAQTIQRNVSRQTKLGSNGLVALDYNLKSKGAYPIGVYSYLITRTDGRGPNGLGVRQFTSYALEKCGPEQAAKLGFQPVAGPALKQAVRLVPNIK